MQLLRPAGSGTAGDGDRGDILLAMGAEGGVTIADISIICPTAATCVANAARTTGYAAAHRDKHKKDKYARGPGAYTFVPLSAETHGRLGEPAMKLLRDLADRAGFREARERASFVANALCELSVAMCQGNGIMFRAGLKNLARCSGTAFAAGAVRPHSEID